jgi:hypothetical protein
MTKADKRILDQAHQALMSAERLLATMSEPARIEIEGEMESIEEVTAKFDEILDGA